MSAQKSISLRIPASVKWSEADLAQKAENHEMNKSEFMMMAIDCFMNFDDEFLKTVKDRTVSLHIPMYVAIQNTIIAQFARMKAKDKVFGGMVHTSEEFTILKDASGWHRLTGKALEEYLIDLYVKEFEQEKKD